MEKTQKKEWQRYTIVLVMTDNTLKSVFTGYFMECVHAANHLLDKYNWPRKKMIFINDETYEIVNIRRLIQAHNYTDLGSLAKYEEKLMPWDKGYHESH